MLTKREIVLAKFLNQNPLNFKKGEEDFQYIYKDVDYLVLTPEESLNRVINDFKEDFSSYYFSLAFLSKVIGVEEKVLENRLHQQLDKDNFLYGNDNLLAYIKETIGLDNLVKACVEANGGYGYYISGYDHSQVEKDGYLIYRCN